MAADGVRDGRSEEVERGKSSARSTIFPSRRAVTFYLASFGECSDWSVGERNFVFLARRGANAGARTHTYIHVHIRARHTFRVAFSQPPRRDVSSIGYFASKLDNDLKTQENRCSFGCFSFEISSLQMRLRRNLSPFLSS